MSDLILTYTGNEFYASGFTLNNEDMEHEFSVDWGDGSEIQTKTMGNDTGIFHTYNTTGNYTITIRGVNTNIEVIDNSTLSQITGLTSVIIPNTVTAIEYSCFEGCTELTSVTIPNSVTSIGEYCFSGCSGLTSVTISNSVTSIPYGCFYGCTGLTSVTIPNSVTSIEGYCFNKCSDLTSITFEGTTPPQIESDAFDNTLLETIYVPNGSLIAYQNAEGFPENVTFVEYTPQSSSSSGSSDPTATLYNHIKQLNKQWFYEKPEIDQSLLTKSIAIVEKSSANSGAFKTYQITQGGVAVSGEIDIPKDFLVKSGSIKTAGSTPTTAESNAGVLANEKYISLIVNTKDNETSSGNTELIIPAKGLVEDTLYYADESTITLYVDSNDGNKNKFKIKDGGVDTAQLKNGAVTSDKIASAVKNSWVSSSDVEDAINGALNDLAELIYPTSNQSP